MNAQTGIINIRGKEYQTVALRVQLFRDKHPDHSLTTSVVCRDEECVVMQAAIGDTEGRIIAVGHAEEYRKSSQINRTSALENAETSAIGRALAAFGIGGTEFASANEVVNAIHQQGNGTVRDTAGECEVSPDGPANYPSPHPIAGETVSKDYVFPEGPASGITQLKAMARNLWREIEGCGDDDELQPLLTTDENKKIMAQLAALENPAHRTIWDGDGGDNPGIAGLILRKQTEFAQQRPNILQAG